MVRQLLTVTRLESGALKPRGEVVVAGPPGPPGVGGARRRRASPFTLDDRSAGWLAVADVDQLDQVLWALLDNAVKYGGGTPIRVEHRARRRTSASCG